MKKITIILSLLGLTLMGNAQSSKKIRENLNFSGIYPHLAYYNNEGECGTGAVVPWADRLWVITYGPHCPFGSSDKLYEITNDLHESIRPESIGGTPADRLIHKESNQLFIGPYAIDAHRNVRVISNKEAPGRYTGAARHLSDPAGKIYIATMEEGFYEIDVNTLKTRMLYEDGNVKHEKGKDITANLPGSLLPGAHGKGLYSGQGVLIFANNGEASKEALTKFDIESGVLAEWDGENWKVIRRNQFTEITGPGGIYGNANPATDPIWTIGWDHKSLLLGLRDHGTWSFFRLPKASHSYDGAHGWNTEWPRIRDVGTPQQPDYLMTMHGMFWHFPGTFSSANHAGIRPASAYLKVIGDFTRWNNQLVFGCDDAAHNEFLNKRKVKGNIEGPGQSNSNLWFTSTRQPDQLGPNTSEGSVWLKEAVKAHQPSDPMLFAGWPKRCAWIQNDGEIPARFTFEVDLKGDGNWETLRSVDVDAGKNMEMDFTATEKGEWIRVSVDKPTIATVQFSYSANDIRTTVPDRIFAGLAKVNETNLTGGLLYGLGDNRRALGISVQNYKGGTRSDVGYYELTADMKLVPKDDPKTLEFINERFAIPKDVLSVDESSILIVDNQNRRWRLPLGNMAYRELLNSSLLRICREVSTERDLFSCEGTFYELPAENADGFAKIRPIASHNFRITDYAGYRGMLIMTGINPQAGKNNPHIIVSGDGKAAVWAGVIDDLWKLGKPTGEGGPWKNTAVSANEPSDPYLIGFYDQRELSISHDANEPVEFTIQVDPVGDGPWMTYKTVTVAPGKTYHYTFPGDFQARWIRFVSDKKCKATTWLKYR
ncbi:MAG: hypothetical protein Q8907_09560 [Bacteroidota bacterium]|nr:hypothetical protein [Bacteroidota bacterium]